MRDLGLRVGLALNPDTPFEAVAPYLDQVDLLLCMTVFPGFGGQSFIGEVMPKVRQVRRAAAKAGLTLDVEVDGGIDEHTVVEAALAGANVFVAGSAVFGRPHPLGGGDRHPAGRRGGGGGRPAPDPRMTAVEPDDADWMRRAMDAAEQGPRPHRAQPVGGSGGGARPAPAITGSPAATAPPGGPHAEVAALEPAGPRAEGATLYVTLEPCAHQGRTPPCTDAIIAAGIRRVVVGIEDPDPQVSGRGLAALRAAGHRGGHRGGGGEVSEQLAPYLKHRRTGRPWVVLKLAATLDGRTAAPDGTSQWITGPAARADAHRLRAQSDAVLVGAGTVRTDDPALTVRLPPDDPYARTDADQPVRVVLGPGARRSGGAAGPRARRRPGGQVLDELGAEGIVQLLVEGGATVAHAFHRAGSGGPLCLVSGARPVRRGRRPSALRRSRRTHTRPGLEGSRAVGD